MIQANIRRAESGDLRLIQDLNHDLFLSDNEWLNDLNTNWPYESEGEAYFKRRISGENGVLFVAEIDGKVIGYVAGGWSELNFSAYEVKRGELENICVKKKYRSEGVGTKLVEALFGWFKDQGATYVMIDAYASNTNAINFYEDKGFELYSKVLWKKLR